MIVLSVLIHMLEETFLFPYHIIFGELENWRHIHMFTF